jgi:hypothetical protein
MVQGEGLTRVFILERRWGLRLKLERCMRHRKKTETMSINKSTPKALFLPIGDDQKEKKIELDKFATWWLNINHDTAIFTGLDTGIPQTLYRGPLEIDESGIKNLNRLAEELKERLLFSAILYSGVEGVPLGPKTVAMPFPVFFGI